MPSVTPFFMSKASNLPGVLTRRLIERLASDTSLQRGENYFAGGRVKALVKRGDTLRANVTGTEEYEVRLTAVGGGLEFKCSCPVGMDGDFCKHCVAVSLAWLDSQKPGACERVGGETDCATPVVNLGDLRPWLLKQSTETLASLLLDVAERDDRLREKLLRNAARATSKRIDFPAYRDSITRATAIRGFVSYHEAYGFARGVEEAVEPLEELLAEGHATAVIELAEHALKRVEKAMGQIDDSDGGLGGVLELLQDLHLRACLIAKPDPEALAARLFDWEVRGDWDTFYDAATKYAEAFGRKGLARYRQLAEEAWARLPDLKPGAKEDFSSARFRLTHIMEQAAYAGGNLDALAKIKTKDLSSGRHFLDIARLYANAQRLDEALAWAERGIAAFRDNPDRDLRKFVAEEYHRRGRHDDAVALMWAQFEECPCLRDYQELKEHAGRASVWPVWRECALERLRPNPNADRKKVRGVRGWIPWAERDASELVKVFLWEGEAQAAWLEAKAHGCANDLWIALAVKRQKAHPEDAIPVYQREAERLIDQKDNSSYKEAVAFLAKVKMLMAGMGQRAEWEAFIAGVRARHKAKRNFIAAAAHLG
jgi:uncharacterized Zn finger protein